MFSQISYCRVWPHKLHWEREHSSTASQIVHRWSGEKNTKRRHFSYAHLLGSDSWYEKTKVIIFIDNYSSKFIYPLTTKDEYIRHESTETPCPSWVAHSSRKGKKQVNYDMAAFHTKKNQIFVELHFERMIPVTVLSNCLF